MAVTKFGLKHETGPTEDQEGHRHYTRTFGATTDQLDTGATIRSFARCPKMFEGHPNDARAVAINVDPQRVPKSRNHWEVTVQYTTNVGRQRDPNPLARSAEITGEFNEITRPVFRDRNGRLPQTTAGEPILVEEEESDLILNVQKNIPPILPNWIFTYNNAINGDAVRIRGRTAPQKTLKIKGIRFSDLQVENDVPFMSIGFQLHFRRSGWDREVLNQGLYELVTRFNRDADKNVTSYERIKDALGREITEPVPLTRDGRAHRDFVTNELLKPRPDELVYIKLQTADLMPFSVLPLK